MTIDPQYNCFVCSTPGEAPFMTVYKSQERLDVCSKKCYLIFQHAKCKVSEFKKVVQDTTQPLKDKKITDKTEKPIGKK